MSVTYPDDERPDNSRSVLANMVGNTVQDLGPSMRLHRQLASLSELRLSVKERDRSMCRYCGCEVDWSDRRGGMGGTYHFVDPDGGATLDNVGGGLPPVRGSQAGPGRQDGGSARAGVARHRQ